MRTIKFKGKGIKTGKWHYGNYMEKNDPQKREETFWCCFIQDKALSMYQIERKTVGQFTGLKDKKGVEIYEGDILKHNKNRFFVRFSKNQHVLLLRDCIEKSVSWRNLEWCNNVKKYIEIVGNIHEK